MSGLFSILNVSKTGLFTQQSAINVTSHNVSNANTEGYSRQRTEMQTRTPYCMPSMNSAVGPGQMGTGVEISAIRRVRDSFIDFQFRTETSTYGNFYARDKFLGEVEQIFNEPSDTGISNLMGDMFKSWQELSKQPETSDCRTVVAEKSAALANELNHTHYQLQKVKENAQSVIKDTVFEVNGILQQLQQVNQQIIDVTVAGQIPNDLMDRRDLLLDKLSQKFNIRVDKTKHNGIEVTPVDINQNKRNSLLVRSLDFENVKTFSYISDIKKIAKPAGAPGTAPGAVDTDDYEITYYEKGDLSRKSNEHVITVKGLTKAQVKEIDECRVIWTNKDGVLVKDTQDSFLAKKDKDEVSFADLKQNLFETSDGELKGYMSVQQDVDDYTEQLNKLAKTLALTVNAVHSGVSNEDFSKLKGQSTAALVTSSIDKDGNLTKPVDFVPFFVNKTKVQYKDDGSIENLGDVLASEEEITAENISINMEVKNDVMKIKTRTNDDKYGYESDNIMDGRSDGRRALAIGQLKDKLVEIQNVTYKGVSAKNAVITRKDLFDLTKGGNSLNGLDFKNNINGMKLDTYFKDTIDRLGVQEQEAVRMVKNQRVLLQGFQQVKSSISGVSMDEEMTNLIQFQHCYQANAKIISTVDQLLDVVINGLKR